MTSHDSTRVPAPRDADALAAALRRDTASDEDLARIERGLTRALRERRAAAPTTTRYGLAFAALAVAAAIALWLGRPPAESPVVAEPSLPIAEPVPALATGAELARAEGQLGHARLSVTEGSLVHVDADALASAAVTLVRGEVRVAFHPEHRGAEHLAVVTDVARVEVVGTEFVVARRADGSTHVSVTEGIVRVITLATSEAREITRGESLDVAPPAITAEAETIAPAPRRDERAPAPTSIAPPSIALPSVAQAIAAADAGDVAPLERLADEGDRDARLAALEELGDRHDRTDVAAALHDYDRTLALDPSGEHGATALFARARLRERTHDASAADDFARYLAEFPTGAFAAQAAQRLCALDSTRCTVSP